ncbi:hypothetical protein MESS4_20030 [Mesorhizobium sp. STM 4661]|nr:hypothetical protein MESS4_20030 [Mesorhizobium sp. STM 4661]
MNVPVLQNEYSGLELPLFDRTVGY